MARALASLLGTIFIVVGYVNASRSMLHKGGLISGLTQMLVGGIFLTIASGSRWSNK